MSCQPKALLASMTVMILLPVLVYSLAPQQPQGHNDPTQCYYDVTHSHRLCPDNTPYTFKACQRIYQLYEDACFSSYPKDCKKIGEIYFGPRCAPYWTWLKGRDKHEFPYHKTIWSIAF